MTQLESASVIVPARNERSRLPETLDALGDQDCDLDLEVIVVASDGESLETARSHQVSDRTVLENRPNGAGKARNRGAALASGDLFLFTDADTAVPPTWVRFHRRHYANPDVVGVGGPLRPLSASLRHRLLFRILSDWWYSASWPFGFVQQSGNNCSVRREAFEAVDGFDESLGFIEDTDLSVRLREHGHVVYDSACPVWTSPRRQEREGYVPLFCSYFRGYLEYVLFGRVSECGHFGPD